LLSENVGDMFFQNVGLALLATWFHAGFLRGLFFDSEDGSDFFAETSADF
jgi:hypothetical protein